MAFIREALRILFLNPYVLLWAGVAAALFLFSRSGGLISEEEAEGQRRQAELEAAISSFDQHDVSKEIGAAQAYAFGCDTELNLETLSQILAMFSLSPEALLDGGSERLHWRDGASRVAALLAKDGGPARNREMTCSLGTAAYGSVGTIIPGLLVGTE